MKILIKTSSGESISLGDFDENDTVENIKKKILERTGFGIDEQRLKINGKILEDKITLRDCEKVYKRIEKESPIEVDFWFGCTSMVVSCFSNCVRCAVCHPQNNEKEQEHEKDSGNIEYEKTFDDNQQFVGYNSTFRSKDFILSNSVDPKFNSGSDEYKDFSIHDSDTGENISENYGAANFGMTPARESSCWALFGTTPSTANSSSPENYGDAGSLRSGKNSRPLSPLSTRVDLDDSG